MTTKVESAGLFEREYARLLRKYPAIRFEVIKLLTELEADIRPGDKIPNVGYDVYKVRLRNPSAQRGKSGGLRTIYYVRFTDTVVMLTIYSKSQKADVSIELLRRVIEEYNDSHKHDTDGQGE